MDVMCMAAIDPFSSHRTTGKVIPHKLQGLLTKHSVNSSKPASQEHLLYLDSTKHVPSGCTLQNQ